MLKKITVIIAGILCGALFMGNSNAQDGTSNGMKTETAIFAMGCFWCGEVDFINDTAKEKLPGVLSVQVGYAGGTRPNPTYTSHEGYKEAIKIEFNPAITSYQELLENFWHNIDLFDERGQFCDKGFAYTSAIFFNNTEQKSQAMASKQQLEEQFARKIATEIIPESTFYDAEEYHQNYKSKNPIRYKLYRWNCGRDKRLQEIWNTK
mgnify:CR=1 FL=1